MKKLFASVMATAVLVGGGVVVASPADASTSPGLSDKRAALLSAHNAKRQAKCGANSILRGVNIEDAALYHAKDMADENYFSHDSQHPYEYWADRIDRYITRDVGGENIASGYDTVSSVMAAWMASAGHARNIMDCSFKYVGFGYAEQSGRKMWVADFSY